MSLTLLDSLGNRAMERAEAAFKDVASPADWDRQRAAVRRDFVEGLGMDTLQYFQQVRGSSRLMH